MQMNAAAQFLPSISNDKKVEVIIENDEAVIKLSTFTENLGWCSQKTMRLDAGLLDELHHIIAAARYKLNSHKPKESVAEFSNVIEFPKVA
jgi:hypothetical protein